MRQTPVICIIVLAAFAGVCAQASVRVPHGRSIMIDSRVSEGEWADARSITVSSEVKLHFKQSGEFVFVCIDAPGQPYLTTDTYLAAGGDIFNLHVSAMLGERVLMDGKFSKWAWWNNQGWVANSARIINTAEPKSFLHSQAIEFQISRKRFSGRTWLMKFDVGIPNPTIFPKETTEVTTGNWLSLDLGDLRSK